MCGLAGIFDHGAAKTELMAIGLALNASLAHRGPDSDGIWLDSELPLLLTHQRLAILDLSPLGHQPMLSASRRYTLVYNGEIYNFRELKSELGDAGHKFAGSSDTEVLLAAIEQWGLKHALSRCKGMFALALFDSNTKTLSLARDRIGEKPLYYGVAGRRLLFGSELKAVLAAWPEAQPKPVIDRRAIASYLRYGYISAPESVFREIRKLEPGQILSWKLPQHNSDIPEPLRETYWQLATAVENGNRTQFSDTKIATKALEDTLIRVIERQSVADVSLGAFLSGGIDSTVVTGILQSISSVPVETFTIGFDNAAFNEAKHAELIARHFGTAHNELYLSGADCLDVIPALPNLYDEPFADASQIPTYLVSKLAKSKVSVSLSGDGGDELFAGYNRYFMAERANRIRQKLPVAARKIISATLTAVPPHLWDLAYTAGLSISGRKGGASTGAKLHKLAALLAIDDAESAYRYLCGYWQSPETLLKESGGETYLASGLDFSTEYLDAAMCWDQQWYLPGDNLVKSDRASMAIGLEMRLPLLDADMIDFAWRVPSAMKYRNGSSKWILREVLYRLVPSKLIDRPKMGFSIPLAHWLRNELRDWAESLLDEHLLRAQGIFEPSIVRRVFHEHQSGKVDHSNRLWTLLMFQAWLSEYAGQYRLHD